MIRGVVLAIVALLSTPVAARFAGLTSSNVERLTGR